jgi:hypothetical protein
MPEPLVLSPAAAVVTYDRDRRYRPLKILSMVNQAKDLR